MRARAFHSLAEVSYRVLHKRRRTHLHNIVAAHGRIGVEVDDGSFSKKLLMLFNPLY